MTRPRVLLTSVCRPLGPEHGDASSVGYELLHRQVTRAQGIFSPRATHLTFSLDYIAANLDAPTVVLHYPSHAELVRELRRGPEFVGVSFILATFHRMKEIVALVREHAPQARIVLGGYGTVLDDATLARYGDHVCREEGVGFFRALIGEAPRPMPYDHPLIVSRLKVLSAPVGRTGMIFAGLGCPHGCDFCCTSHFFGRRHIRLLPTGDDVFRVIERYLEIDPGMSFTILDEDFLVNPDRATRLRELVLQRGKPISIFAFATVKMLSRLTPEQLLETGIDGVWIGYEGTRSGFAKQQGRPVPELMRDLHANGISVLASMIVGFDYQTPEVVRAELAGLLALRPTLSQFLIYGPTPGTPFFARVMEEGRLHPELVEDREAYYKKCDGFTAMVTHPTLSPREIEALQDECFRTDYETLGPSVVRTLETWFEGWRRHHDSASPYLRAKAARWKEEIHKAWPLFAAARRYGPVPEATARLQGDVEREMGRPGVLRRALSLAMPFAAAWTKLTLRFDRLQHPSLRRNEYRMGRAALPFGDMGKLKVELERAVRTTVVRIEGVLDGVSARRLSKAIRVYLKKCDAQIQLVVKQGTEARGRGMNILARRLSRQRHRLSLVLPTVPGAWEFLSRWLGPLPAKA